MIGEEINENDYEPCQEELYEYAQYLGMDLQKDQKYLYIAKKGLTAPLPPEWKACKNAEDEIFYKNSKTGEKTWSHPLDDFYKKMFQEAKANIQYYFQQIQDSQSDLIQRQKPLPGKALPKIMAVSAITKKTQLKSLSLENKTNIQESLNKTSVAINDISNNQEKPKKKKVKCPKMYVSEEEIIFMELKKTYSIKINEKMQQFKEQKSQFQQNQSNKSQFNNNSIIYDGLKKIYKEKFEKLKNKLINNEDAELHKQIQTLQGQYKIQQNQKDQSNIKSEKFQKQQQQLNEMRQQLNLQFQLKLDQYQKQIQKIQDQKLNDHLQKLDQEFEYEQRQLLQYTNCQRKIDMRQIQQLKININKQNNDKNLMRQLEIFHQDQIQSTDQQLEKEFKTRSNDKLNQVKIKQKSEILNHQSQLNQDIQQNQKLIHSKFEYQYKQYELSQMKSLSYQNDSYILNIKVEKKSMELLQLQQKNQLLMEKLQIYGSNQKQQNKSEFSSASKNDIDKIIFEINSIKKLVQSQSSKSFYYDDEKIQKTHDYSIDQDSKSQIQKQIYEQSKQFQMRKYLSNLIHILQSRLYLNLYQIVLYIPNIIIFIVLSPFSAKPLGHYYIRHYWLKKNRTLDF